LKLRIPPEFLVSLPSSFEQSAGETYSSELGSKKEAQ
jgi:hypothetical protein